MAVRIETLTGAALTEFLNDLSVLRLAVFAEWPYLYAGDMAYETDYLATFAATPDAVVVAAFDDALQNDGPTAIKGPRIVGAATAAPLAGHTNEFVPLFTAHGFDPDKIFYCGESVLLPPYRGQGIGHAFFDHREAHARRLNAAGAAFTHITFCAVVRPNDRQQKPAGYRPLDAFWRKRGYEPVPGLIGTYAWRDIGRATETDKAMQFWMKEI